MQGRAVEGQQHFHYNHRLHQEVSLILYPANITKVRNNPDINSCVLFLYSVVKCMFVTMTNSILKPRNKKL